MIFTYVVFLHNRQADCAADHCVMNTITADSVEDAETRILEHYAANDPEIITVIEGGHADAR